MAVTGKCEFCGVEFEMSNSIRRFCSRRCVGKAASPRKPVEERRCIADGCDRNKVFAVTGYCHKHQYRFEHYGDPLAKPKRNKRRDDVAIDLDVNWEKLDSSSHWRENPTHCPQGHEYSDDNTYIRTTRDGTRRRICRECHRIKNLRYTAGEKPDRTARCETCGVVWEASQFGLLPKNCKPCKLKRHRAKSRMNSAKRRGQSPKGPTYVCKACGVVSETPAVSGMAPMFCDACASLKSVESKRKLWRKKTLEKYSLTQDQYDALVELQGCKCAICGTTEPGEGIRRWHVDHDHACCGADVSCGKCVRGLLCSRCNTALGLMNDSREQLSAALQYLLNPPATPIVKD